MGGPERYLLTGGSGFVGRAVYTSLQTRGHEVFSVSRRTSCDLRDPAQFDAVLARYTPDKVIHLAGVVGGIGRNMKEPATLWHDNLLMGLNVIKCCARANVKKLILIGTTCSYPKTPPNIPFRETDLFEGYPEHTNAAYGIAKRALYVGAMAYRQEAGLNSMTLIPTNMYGPGDNFDPNTSHVIPAIMLKMKEAIAQRKDHVVLWGTGQATRDFLYVQDAADGICHLAAYQHEVLEPVNLGSGNEVSILKVAEEIKKISGYTGQILWDVSKPDGQPRRLLDISNARKLGWKPRTSLPVGLKNVWDSLNG